MILQGTLHNLGVAGTGYDVLLLATVAYAIIVVVGLVTVTIFIVVLIKARPILKEFPFFTIVWQLTLSNALNLVSQVTCIVPCTFLDSREGQMSRWYVIGADIVEFTDIAVVFFVLLMALNRFAVFVMRPLERLFRRKNIHYTISATWLMIATITALNLSIGPVQRFEREWKFMDFFVAKHSLTTVIIIFGYAVPIAILALYIVTYAYIRKGRPSFRSTTTNYQNDVALLWQGFLVAVSLIFFRTINSFAPRVNAAPWKQWILNVLNEMASAGNHMLNPILFLSSNKTVRKVLARILGFRRNKIHSQMGIAVFHSESPPRLNIHTNVNPRSSFN